MFGRKTANFTKKSFKFLHRLEGKESNIIMQFVEKKNHNFKIIGEILFYFAVYGPPWFVVKKKKT